MSVCAWPSASVSGMPSTNTLTPRTPNAERAPKPRMEIRRFWAKLLPLLAYTPGVRLSAESSWALARPCWIARASVTSTAAGEASTSVFRRRLRTSIGASDSRRSMPPSPSVVVAVSWAWAGSPRARATASATERCRYGRWIMFSPRTRRRSLLFYGRAVSPPGQRRLFFRRERANRYRVDIGLHQCAQRFVDELVSLDGRSAGESR